MNRLSDDYIRSLEPETLRYDVTIDEDFVISVLPNGIKTWAFLYVYAGRQRRKTLGVYPDMSHDQAMAALRNARSMIAKLSGEDLADAPVEDDQMTIPMPPHATQSSPAVRPAVLAPGIRRKTITLETRSAGRRKRRLLVPLLASLGVAGAAAAGVLLWRGAPDRVPALQEPQAAPQVPAQTRPAPQPRPQRAPPKPIILEPAGDEPPAPEPKPDGGAGASGQTNSSLPATGRPPEPTPRDSAARLAATPGPATTAPPPPAKIDRALDGGDARASPAPAARPAAPSRPAAAATTSGGRVTRAILTSRVSDLEPVDDLGQTLALTNGGYRTVFFFTELRNFPPGQVIHRWTVNGRVIAEVPLRVGHAGRWRTYSSKDLLPGMTGEWEAAVLDGKGDVVRALTFTFGR